MRIFKNKLVNEYVCEAQECTNELWKEIIMMVRMVTKKILGESKGYIRCDKEI